MSGVKDALTWHRFTRHPLPRGEESSSSLWEDRRARQGLAEEGVFR
jgi:hypothetical protein